jgi:hypothetical protein
MRTAGWTPLSYNKFTRCCYFYFFSSNTLIVILLQVHIFLFNCILPQKLILFNDLGYLICTHSYFFYVLTCVSKLRHSWTWRPRVIRWVETFRRNLLLPSSGFPTTRLHGIHSRPVTFITNLLISVFLITRAALPERKPDLAVYTFQSLHQSGCTVAYLRVYRINVAGHDHVAPSSAKVRNGGSYISNRHVLSWRLQALNLYLNLVHSTPTLSCSLLTTFIQLTCHFITKLFNFTNLT